MNIQRKHAAQPNPETLYTLARRRLAAARKLGAISVGVIASGFMTIGVHIGASLAEASDRMPSGGGPLIGGIALAAVGVGLNAASTNRAEQATEDLVRAARQQTAQNTAAQVAEQIAREQTFEL